MCVPRSTGRTRRPATVAIAVLLYSTFGYGQSSERRELAIEGLKEPLSNLSWSDLQGRDLSTTLRPRREGERVVVSRPRPEPIVVKPKTIGTIAVPAGEKAVLPGGIVLSLDERDGMPGRVESGWYRLTLAASPTPALWNHEIGSYVATLTFGLRRPPQITEDVPLPEPVLVKFGFEGVAAPELAPLEIWAPGLANEKTVELQFRPVTPQPKLRIRSTLSDVDIELKATERLELRTQQRELLGLGLERVEVTIERVWPHGEAFPVERETPIAIESDGRARAEPAAPVFAAESARATVRVRSAGWGPVTLTATAKGVSGRVTLEQRFPTAPVIAALLGGALGGFARRFVKGARRRQHTRRVIEGVVVSTVAFVGGVIGVGVCGMPPEVIATEAGAFLVGTLAGFAGVTVLERWVKKEA